MSGHQLENPGPPVLLEMSEREFATLLDALAGHLDRIAHEPWPSHLEPPAKWEPYFPIIEFEHFITYLPLSYRQLEALYKRLLALQQGVPEVKEGEIID